MKCLVTGGSGFLGSHVAEILTEKGHNVTIYDKRRSKWILPKQKMVIGNLLDKKKLDKTIKGKDIVFHFAALADLNQALYMPAGSVNINILGTVNALELSKIHKIKRFVYASTIYVNSEQGGFYRVSKKAAEDYVQEYSKRFNLNYSILRFGSLYGDRSDKSNGVYKIIVNAIKNKEISYFGNRKTVREYINVVDAAKATVESIKKNYTNKYLTITGTRKIKVEKFLNILAKQMHYDKKIIFKNKKILGHYILNPHNYKEKKGIKFKFKSTISFEKGIRQLTNKLKNKII